ncbi:MAG: Ca-activated chloride channel [Solirubrobacteraceae bacterium]|jgi:Ca-activated chloride channel family protein|nr:Ca-activated chloride channel [Solirubrobacteraceae bacterium]
MSFGSPLVLVALLLLPALVVWYVRMQRGRQRAAAAFASPALLASVAPRRPGWRRHAPMVAFALAIAVLIVAAAKPERTVAVPVERAAIMLATDVSGSMQATDVKPSRLVAARRAARRFVEDVPSGVNIGVMAFNGRPRVLQSPTPQRDDILAALARLTPSGGTATGEAITAALRSLRTQRANGRRPPPSAIVLLSDGASTKGKDPVQAAQEARRARIAVYTVALGTPGGTIQVPRPGSAGGTETRRVPPDPASLAQIAQASGGEHFDAIDSAQLKRVYERLGSQLGTEKRKRQMTASFAGGALVLLLAGAGMSLGWFGRLV